MINYYLLADGKITPCDNQEGNILLFISPNLEERKIIETVHGVDEHDIKSALDPDELGRLDFEDNYSIYIIKRPKNYSSADNLLFIVNSLGMFLFKDKLIIIMSEDLKIFETKQLSKAKSLVDIVIKILDGSISHFMGHLKVISMLSDELERKIQTSMGNQYLLNMFTLEKSLVYYLNAINSNSTVIDKLKINHVKIGFTEENMDMVGEITIENQQCRQQAEIYFNILTGLMDARGSIVNNNLSVQMKRLTVISIVFMPLNLLAGIGGMSEFSMMTAGIKWTISYSLFLTSMVLIGYITYMIVKYFGEGVDEITSKKKKRKKMFFIPFFTKKKK